MKIIEMGKLPEEQIFHGRCYNCQTKLEAKESELKREFSAKNEVWYEAICLLCNSRVTSWEKVNDR